MTQEEAVTHWQKRARVEWYSSKATKEKAGEWLKKTEQLLSQYLKQ